MSRGEETKRQRGEEYLDSLSSATTESLIELTVMFKLRRSTIFSQSVERLHKGQRNNVPNAITVGDTHDKGGNDKLKYLSTVHYA